MSFLQRTQKVTTSTSSQSRSETNGFGGFSVLLNFLCKKTDRLAAGVFVVTESLQKDNPLRTSLRARALDTLHALYQLESQNISPALSLFAEMRSLLSVAVSTGSISEDHGSILDGEYQKLSHILIDRKGEVLKGDNFDSIVEQVAQDEPDLFLNSSRGGMTRVSPIGREDVIKDKTGSGLSYNKGQSKGHPSDFSIRQGKILEIVDFKGSVSIRDIAGSIKDCSEKTLQRELLALVGIGVLKKEGERRWSTYKRP